MIRSTLMIAACLSALLIASAGRARAATILTATELGSDVFLSGGGTIDLADLMLISSTTAGSGIAPTFPAVTTGPTSFFPSVDLYEALIGPGSFGSGGIIAATSGTGDLFGVDTDSTTLFLILPQGYVSGNTLSGTSTFQNQSFASLGVTPGTYVWTWGSGANADSFTLNIEGGTTVVPEPSTLAMVGGGICWLCTLMRRRKRTAFQ